MSRLLRDRTGRFVAQLEDGTEIAAQKVVLASGIESHRILPECLSELPLGRVFHSWAVADYEGLTGKQVLVVGGGQSAAEALAHLAPSNVVTWVHRSPLIFFAEPINLPGPLFKLVLRLSAALYYVPRWARRHLAGRFVASTITPELRPRLLNGRVRRVQADVSTLGLGERAGRVYSPVLGVSFDNVIACTGYRYSLDTLGYLDQSLKEQIVRIAPGAPRLGRDFSTSVPGLYMVGGMAEPTHGPAQRFMLGCKTATLRVSGALGQ